jgi:hypothetical protein
VYRQDLPTDSAADIVGQYCRFRLDTRCCEAYHVVKWDPQSWTAVARPSLWDDTQQPRRLASYRQAPPAWMKDMYLTTIKRGMPDLSATCKEKSKDRHPEDDYDPNQDRRDEETEEITDFTTA